MFSSHTPVFNCFCCTFESQIFEWSIKLKSLHNLKIHDHTLKEVQKSKSMISVTNWQSSGWILYPSMIFYMLLFITCLDSRSRHHKRRLKRCLKSKGMHWVWKIVCIFHQIYSFCYKCFMIFRCMVYDLCINCLCNLRCNIL